MSSILDRDKPVTLDTFTRGIWEENPVFVMLLGMCPVLAVTNSVMNALAMGLATTFVLVCSSALVSCLRHTIPKQVRIASYIIIIATFVTIVDYLIQAVSLELYKALGAFIQLIVVNCIILGRAEAYASKFPITKTIVNSLGMSVGFTIALLCLGSVRELLGSGTFWVFLSLGIHSSHGLLWFCHQEALLSWLAGYFYFRGCNSVKNILKRMQKRPLLMESESLSFIFLNAFLINNFVLALFLGICPFLGVSQKLEMAFPMGLATMFVMLVSSICAFAINVLLVLFDLEFLRLICYIAVIASAVQLVEMVIKKYSPTLFRSLGIYLPLITSNCAILGLALFQTNKDYNFLQSSGL